MSVFKSIKDVFKFGGKRLRVFGTSEEPWFCGKDVGKILGYKRTADAIKANVKDKYKIRLLDLYKKIGVGAEPTLSNNEKNMFYIKEAGLYSLIMKSHMKEAEKFQDWVFEKVLPSIRKNGYYVGSNVSNDKIKQLEKELEEQKNLNNRLHNIQKELLSYKKRIERNEIIYVVSTMYYARQGIFKVGRTRGQMKFRSSGHNTTHIKGDKVIVLATFKVNDSTLVERNIHTKLKGLLVEGEREFFICPFDLLTSLIDMIVNNDDEENKQVNKIIDTVYKLKQSIFNPRNWMAGIPEDKFKETLTITNGPEETQLDVTNWTEQHKREFISKCVQEYVKQQDKVNKDYQMLWKTFRVFLVEQLSIPKFKFKVKDWKPLIKEEVNKKDKLSIKWRGST